MCPALAVLSSGTWTFGGEALPVRTNQETRSKAGAAVAIAAGVFLLPLLYVLSLGPAVFLVDHGWINEGLFRGVYAPLEWVYQKVPAVQPSLDYYIKLFEE
jgi:hypothetical protein